MEIVSIYKCLCDRSRLRILNLLIDGPLCVCHLHEILDEPQPKISKALRYMKENGMLTATRHFNWTIYDIADRSDPILATNLACLQDVRAEDEQFSQDIKSRRKVIERIARENPTAPIIAKSDGSCTCDC